MTGDAPSRLARALHELLVTVHATDLDGDHAGRLADEVETLTAALSGPPRLRWYEQPDGDADERRAGWRQMSLYRGEHQAMALPLSIERVETDDGPMIAGSVRCDRMYEGPPGMVHGGYLAGLFDDLLGACLSLVDGPGGVTGRLTVRYRRPTPLDTDLRFVARPVEVRGRRFRAHVVCLVDGQVTAEAEGLFLRRPLGPPH